MIVLDTHIWIWWLTTDDKRSRIGSSSRQRLSTDA